MMSSAALLLIATLALAAVITHAQPLSSSSDSSSSSSAHAPSTSTHTQRIQKRTISKDPSPEELAVLKDLILSRVASELSENLREQQPLAKRVKEESERQKEAEEEEAKEAEEKEAMLAEAKAKRMFGGSPLSGLPGELPTMKRQIRYHQCYFNPISCFRRK